MTRPSVPSVPLPVTARGQRTRQRLVDAAEEVFGQKGYEAASIADITREAEVALGTFYVYFTDKKALFIEVVDALGERLREALAQGTAGVEGRVAVERAGLKAFLQFAHKHRLLYRVVRQAEFVDEDTYRRYYARIAEPYAEALQAAMEAGEVRRMDAETLAYCLMGVGDFLGMRFVHWRTHRELERVLEAAMDFIAHGIAPHATSAASPAAEEARADAAAPARKGRPPRSG